jgi:hypothetical protein
VRELKAPDQEAFRLQYEEALERAREMDELSFTRADVLYAFGRK